MAMALPNQEGKENASKRPKWSIYDSLFVRRLKQCEAKVGHFVRLPPSDSRHFHVPWFHPVMRRVDVKAMAMRPCPELQHDAPPRCATRRLADFSAPLLCCRISLTRKRCCPRLTT